MTWFAFGSPLLLVPLILLCIMATGAIVRAVRIPRSIARYPCCGRCGHECAEPLTDRCAECGGQFVKFGLVTPALAVGLRGGLRSAIIAWTALWSCVVIVAWIVARQQAWSSTPTVVANTSELISTYTLHPYAGNGPGGFDPNILDYRVLITHTGIPSDGSIVTTEMQFELRRSGYKRATFDLVVGQHRFSGGTQGNHLLIRDTTFTEANARAMFEFAEIDLSDPVIRRSLVTLTDLVQEATLDPKILDARSREPAATAVIGDMRVVDHGTTTSSTMFGGALVAVPLWTVPWVVVTGLFLLLAYPIGTILIMRRHGHLVGAQS